MAPSYYTARPGVGALPAVEEPEPSFALMQTEALAAVDRCGLAREGARVASPIRDLIAQARTSGEWRPVIEAVPYFRFLGLDMVNDRGALEGKLTFSDHLVGNPTLPAIHGGVMGALLEATAQCELLYRAESAVLPKTITLTIDYLRSAKPVETRARAEVLKHGRRVATVLVRAYQDDLANPVAVATVHLLVRAD